MIHIYFRDGTKQRLDADDLSLDSTNLIVRREAEELGRFPRSEVLMYRRRPGRTPASLGRACADP